MDRNGRVIHCRDERISRTREPICHKQSQSVAELMANECRNCGRPFVPESAVLDKKEEPDA